MKKINNLFLYLRHISFIALLIAMIIMYSGFDKYRFGNMCLVVSFIYVIVTFIMFFIKNKAEEDSVLNNLVLCFLHIYICFVTYKFQVIGNYALASGNEYFSFNFLMISICMAILCLNKLIIANNK